MSIKGLYSLFLFFINKHRLRIYIGKLSPNSELDVVYNDIKYFSSLKPYDAISKELSSNIQKHLCFKINLNKVPVIKSELTRNNDFVFLLNRYKKYILDSHSVSSMIKPLFYSELYYCHQSHNIQIPLINNYLGINKSQTFIFNNSCYYSNKEKLLGTYNQVGCVVLFLQLSDFYFFGHYSTNIESEKLLLNKITIWLDFISSLTNERNMNTYIISFRPEYYKEKLSCLDIVVKNNIDLYVKFHKKSKISVYDVFLNTNNVPFFSYIKNKKKLSDLNNKKDLVFYEE